MICSSQETESEVGGPIIEHEILAIKPLRGSYGLFVAYKASGIGPHRGEFSQFGPTQLITAMRCYVASKLGDEIEIPEELRT